MRMIVLCYMSIHNTIGVMEALECSTYHVKALTFVRGSYLFLHIGFQELRH